MMHLQKARSDSPSYDKTSKELKEQISMFKAAMGGSSAIAKENMAADSGLVKVYAYHCQRCNYVWFPRDFDYHRRLLKKRKYPGEDLFEREPPKSCARCKSRSWNTIPRRKPKSNHIFKDYEMFQSEGIKESIEFHPEVVNRARIRALFRNGKRPSWGDIFQYTKESE